MFSCKNAILSHILLFFLSVLGTWNLDQISTQFYADPD